MLPPLGEWDESIILSVATPDETAEVEKKAAAKFDLAGNKRDTRDEIAKQVCAFANSGGGYLVFGIDRTGKLDAGIAGLVGTTPTKDWVEAEIPRLLSPNLHGCEARFISIAAHHGGGHGVLVIAIPSSNLRPHWIPGNPPEVAYIRAGAHSLPMRQQTFLDIATHGETAEAEIVGLGVSQKDAQPTEARYVFNPVVRLTAGSICREWAFEIRLPEGAGFISCPRAVGETNISYSETGVFALIGHEPLLLGRPTKVSSQLLWMHIKGDQLTDQLEVLTTLYLGSGRPVSARFRASEL